MDFFQPGRIFSKYIWESHIYIQKKTHWRVARLHFPRALGANFNSTQLQMGDGSASPAVGLTVDNAGATGDITLTVGTVLDTTSLSSVLDIVDC